MRRRAPRIVRVGATFVVALAPILAACAGETRDVVAGGTDRTVTDAGGPVEGYEHVVKRAHVIVGLAESRGLGAAEAKKATEVVAEQLESCVASERARGKVQAGAARLVAYVDAGGAVGPPKITHSGGNAGSIALLCVAAPLRLLQFDVAPDAGAGTRGLAIEASWTE